MLTLIICECLSNDFPVCFSSHFYFLELFLFFTACFVFCSCYSSSLLGFQFWNFKNFRLCFLHIVLTLVVQLFYTPWSLQGQKQKLQSRHNALPSHHHLRCFDHSVFLSKDEILRRHDCSIKLEQLNPFLWLYITNFTNLQHNYNKLARQQGMIFRRVEKVIELVLFQFFANLIKNFFVLNSFLYFSEFFFSNLSLSRSNPSNMLFAYDLICLFFLTIF